MKLGSSEGGGTLDSRLPEGTLASAAVAGGPPGDEIRDGLDDMLLKEPANNM